MHPRLAVREACEGSLWHIDKWCFLLLIATVNLEQQYKQRDWSDAASQTNSSDQHRVLLTWKSILRRSAFTTKTKQLGCTSVAYIAIVGPHTRLLNSALGKQLHSLECMLLGPKKRISQISCQDVSSSFTVPSGVAPHHLCRHNFLACFPRVVVRARLCQNPFSQFSELQISGYFLESCARARSLCSEGKEQTRLLVAILLNNFGRSKLNVDAPACPPRDNERVDPVGL